MTDRTNKIVASTTAAAIAIAAPLVLYFEGNMRRVYFDPINVATVCVGSTTDLNGRRLTVADVGKSYTAEQCETMLQRDLKAHGEVLACITRPVSVYVKAATISFAYNVGTNAVCRSTYMKKLNAGDPTACAELSRWTIARNKELPGLVKRRAAERELCEKKA